MQNHDFLAPNYDTHSPSRSKLPSHSGIMAFQWSTHPSPSLPQSLFGSSDAALPNRLDAGINPPRKGPQVNDDSLHPGLSASSNSDPYPEGLVRFYHSAEAPWTPERSLVPIKTHPPNPSFRRRSRVSIPGANVYRTCPRSELEASEASRDSGYHTRTADTRSLRSTEPAGLGQELLDLSSVNQREHINAPGAKTSSQSRIDTLPAAPQNQSYHASSSRKDLECTICGAASKCPSDFKKHKLKHEKPWKCDVPECKRVAGFTTPNDLDRHKKCVHKLDCSSTKTFICAAPNCQKKTKKWPRGDNFKQHIIRMHPEENVDDLMKRSECLVNPPFNLPQAHIPYQCPSESCWDNANRWPDLDSFKHHLEAMHKKEDHADLMSQSGSLRAVATRCRIDCVRFQPMISSTPSPAILNMNTLENTVAGMDVADKHLSLQPSDNFCVTPEALSGPWNAENFETSGPSFEMDPEDPGNIGQEHSGPALLNAVGQTLTSPGESESGSDVLRAFAAIANFIAQQDDGYSDLPSIHDFQRSPNNSPDEPSSQSQLQSSDVQTSPVDPESCHLTGPGHTGLPESGTAELASRNINSDRPTPKDSSNPRPQESDSETEQELKKNIIALLMKRKAKKSYLDAGGMSSDFNSSLPQPSHSQQNQTSSDNSTKTSGGGITSEEEKDIEKCLNSLLKKSRPKKCMGSGDPAKFGPDGRFKCPTCHKVVSQKCKLTKHMKRHSRPYGCTFPKCFKAFGSKCDWKRHENGQHFQLEVWRCQQQSAGKMCGQLFYQIDLYKKHLLRIHGCTSDQTSVEIKQCRIGRNGQSRFWCGFCAKIHCLKNRGITAWDERFNHIDHHFTKEKMNILDWLCIEANKTKGEVKRQVDKSNWSDEDPTDSTLGPDESEWASQADAQYQNKAKSGPAAAARASKKRRRADRDPIIFCCECNSGPWNYSLSAMCPECQHVICHGCTTEYIVLNEDRDESKKRSLR